MGNLTKCNVCGNIITSSMDPKGANVIKLTHKIVKQLNTANQDLINAREDFHRDGLGTNYALYFVLRFDGKGTITDVQFDAGAGYLTIKPVPEFDEIYLPGPALLQTHFIRGKAKWEQFLAKRLPDPLVLGRVVEWRDALSASAGREG